MSQAVAFALTSKTGDANGMRERMSDVESINWTLEQDPSLRSVVVIVTILDQAPDLDRLRKKLSEAVATIPRLRKRVVPPIARVGLPEWRDDTRFDLDYHLQRAALPGPGTERDLLNLAGVIKATPFDLSRPLWKVIAVEGLADGRGAIIQKVHRTMSEGTGGLRFSASLVDREREPSPKQEEAWSSSWGIADRAAAAEIGRLSEPLSRTPKIRIIDDIVSQTIRRPYEVARIGMSAFGDVIANPSSAPDAVAGLGNLVTSTRRQMLLFSGPLSPLMTERSLARRFETFNVSVADAGAAAKVLDGTVDHVLMTGLSGALGLYHDRMGKPCDELRIGMPVDLRDGSAPAVGNNFSPARFIIPVQPKDPAARFRLVKSKMRAVRSEPSLDVVHVMAGVINLLPIPWLTWGATLQTRSLDAIFTNLRGAPFELFIAGGRVESTAIICPRTGSALNATAVSYMDDFAIGLNIDPAAITDPAGLLECMEESFGSLLAVAGS